MPSVPPPKLHGLITIDTTNQAFRIRGAVTAVDRDITLTAGDYFIRGYTGEAANQLAEHIQAQVRAAAGTEFDAFVVSVSDTGFVTFTNTAEAFTVTTPAGQDWFPSSGGLARLLGFTGDLTPAVTTFTGANQHRYGWYPDMPPEDFSGHPDLAGVLGSDSVVSIAPSGRVTVTSYQEPRRRSWSFRWLAAEYMFPTGSVRNRDFEQCWRDEVRPGRRWRYYPDRTVQTRPGGGEPWTYVGGQDIAIKGAGAAEQDVVASADHFRIEIDAHEFVA